MAFWPNCHYVETAKAAYINGINHIKKLYDFKSGIEMDGGIKVPYDSFRLAAVFDDASYPVTTENYMATKIYGQNASGWAKTHYIANSMACLGPTYHWSGDISNGDHICDIKDIDKPDHVIPPDSYVVFVTGNRNQAREAERLLSTAGYKWKTELVNKSSYKDTEFYMFIYHISSKKLRETSE